MSAVGVLSLLSAAVSLVFTSYVLHRYYVRRSPQHLLWAIGLVWYGTSTYAQYLGAVHGWEPFLYRVWYLAGGYFVAAYLGMGTLYLLAPRRVADRVMLALVLASVGAAAVVFTAPVDPGRLPAPGDNPTGEAFPPFPSSPVRTLTPIFNVFGTLLLVGGALWSAWVFYRRRTAPERVVSNVLIAAGAMISATASALTRFGVPAGLAVGQLVGLLLILAGSLAAEVARPKVPSPARQGQR